MNKKEYVIKAADQMGIKRLSADDPNTVQYFQWLLGRARAFSAGHRPIGVSLSDSLNQLYREILFAYQQNNNTQIRGALVRAARLVRKIQDTTDASTIKPLRADLLNTLNGAVAIAERIF